MKLFIFAIFAVAVAQGARDWSKVKYFDFDPISRRYTTHYFGSGRIVGGNEAQPNSIPYQVGMMIDTSDGTYFCGGSLISENYVMTAAHCVDKATQVEVVLGAHKIREEDEPTQVRVFTADVQVHPGWDPLLLRNDIAIVGLPTAVTLNENIQVVTLPKHSDADHWYDNELGKVSGWGKDSDEATGISPVLRYVQAPILAHETCKAVFLGIVVDSHICSKGDGKVGACSGDSGGPIVIEGVQVGIVSFGLSLGCEIGFPSVYTRVTSFLDYIESHTDVVIEH